MTPDKIDNTPINKIENTLEQNQYKEYLKNIRINQDTDSLFKWADFFSVKDIPNWNIVILDLKKINSYINIQLQQINKGWKLVPVWKEYPVLVHKDTVYDLDLNTWNIQLSNNFNIYNWKINLINKKEANKLDNTQSDNKEYSDYEKALWLNKEFKNDYDEDASYWIDYYEEEELEEIYIKEKKWLTPDNQLGEPELKQMEFDKNEEIFEIPEIKPKNLSLYENMEYDVQEELNNLILDTTLKTDIFYKFQEIYDWDFETNTIDKAKEFYQYIRNQWLNILQATMILWETTEKYLKNKIK